MKKISEDKYRKTYKREYSRVFSKKDLDKERAALIERLQEVNSLISEITGDKNKKE